MNKEEKEIVNDLLKAIEDNSVWTEDKYGNMVLSFNTEGMFRGYIKEGSKPVVNMYE